ncbi:hypothetical protein EYC80_004867 [Monilinia laxa]|uniref:Uncharacterized protein n=1 Tax=Monilinia laxa TaxID=61186 RepID=A0A5N6KIB0_MONLA|nr:hypothetical protein EYC80_004867 [Monilinia laxa]
MNVWEVGKQYVQDVVIENVLAFVEVLVNFLHCKPISDINKQQQSMAPKLQATSVVQQSGLQIWLDNSDQFEVLNKFDPSSRLKVPAGFIRSSRFCI